MTTDRPYSIEEMERACGLCPLSEPAAVGTLQGAGNLIEQYREERDRYRAALEKAAADLERFRLMSIRQSGGGLPGWSIEGAVRSLRSRILRVLAGGES